MRDNCLSFTDLKCKDVINVCDGARLGRICDIELEVFDCSDVRLTAIVLPGPARFFGIIRSDEELVISCRCIKKIGDDVILVDLPAKD
ncbi:MAG TPA: YlmC/YmxH family sporulation protein [Feifaniaceae bacterium]|nr:YlmC/YmxH family sporulation protein [Feifaniaceae bacterium]